MSIADVLTYLWNQKLVYPDALLDFGDVSRLVVSKGHSAPILYALGYHSGLIRWNELKSFRQIGSRLQGHPDVVRLPWVEASTGSLGQGFSVAVGMALAKKLLNRPGEVFCILGDGELGEGQIWEAALFARQHDLGNLTAIVDRNGLQSDDATENILALEPLRNKWESFGWQVFEIDGHNFDEIGNAIAQAECEPSTPSIIIANTVKGKGISFMENVPSWHGSVAMDVGQVEMALQELAVSSDNVRRLVAGEPPK